jgi:hypothetical protein
MDREQIHDWVQIIGIFAVVLSLLFVGYEIKQSRDIAVAQMYQQRAELDISMRSLWIPDEELWKIRQMMGEEKDFSRLSNFERETLCCDPWITRRRHTNCSTIIGLRCAGNFATVSGRWLTIFLPNTASRLSNTG